MSLPSLAFNMSMFIWSTPVSVPLFIYYSGASTSHCVIPGISFRSVCIIVRCSLSKKLLKFVLWYYLDRGFGFRYILS